MGDTMTSSPLSFRVSVAGESDPRAFTKNAGESTTVGRGPKNDVVLTNTSVSGQHVELKAIAGKRALSVKDLSTNGIGIRTTESGPLTRLDKGVDVEVLAGKFFLYLPFKVKAKDEATAEGMRMKLQIDVDKEGEEDDEATPAPAVVAKEAEAEKADEAETAPPAEEKKRREKKEKEEKKDKAKEKDEGEKSRKEKKDKAEKKDEDDDD